MADVRELASLIEQDTGIDGVHETAIPHVRLYRASRVSEPVHSMSHPGVCFVAQGRKQAVAGDGVYVYDPDHFLVVSVDVPIQTQVLEASVGRPLLCLWLDLDPAVLGSLILECEASRARREKPESALAISAVTLELLDACIRLLELLSAPRDRRILAPLVEREIVYRLLQTDQVSRLRRIANAESRQLQVHRAILAIKRNFREVLHVATLATEAGMSASALHQHFKAVTGLSPIQYQKRLRLQEARRLMLCGTLDAAGASQMVGYESPSQFSREYRRLFGAPPARDVATLKSAGDRIVQLDRSRRAQ